MMSELTRYLKRQARWSMETFGEGPHTLGILDHIGKEVKEVKASPFDLEEWIDIMILAFDGYMRHGGLAKDLMWRLESKQAINFARRYPILQAGDENRAIEHIREKAGA